MSKQMEDVRGCGRGVCEREKKMMIIIIIINNKHNKNIYNIYNNIIIKIII